MTLRNRCIQSSASRWKKNHQNAVAGAGSPEYNLSILSGEVTELVPVPDFKSGGSWLGSGKVSSILMLSRQIFQWIRA